MTTESGTDVEHYRGSALVLVTRRILPEQWGKVIRVDSPTMIINESVRSCRSFGAHNEISTPLFFSVSQACSSPTTRFIQSPLQCPPQWNRNNCAPSRKRIIVTTYRRNIGFSGRRWKVLSSSLGTYTFNLIWDKHFFPVRAARSIVPPGITE